MTRPIPIVFGDHAGFQAMIEANLDSTRFSWTFQTLAHETSGDAAAVLPLSEHHYSQLQTWPDGGRNLALQPGPAIAGLCSDKLALNRFLIDHGFGETVPSLRDPGAPWPYVWKRRRGGWGRHVQVIRSAEDEVGLDFRDPDYFAQALVEDEVEYAAHILRDRGRIWYAATTCYGLARPDAVFGVFEQPLRMTFQRGCVHLRLFAAILQALDYQGTACFDYKLVDGTPRIFEINPRFGSSLAHDINGYVEHYLIALQARRQAAEPGPVLNPT